MRLQCIYILKNDIVFRFQNTDGISDTARTGRDVQAQVTFVSVYVSSNLFFYFFYKLIFILFWINKCGCFFYF